MLSTLARGRYQLSSPQPGLQYIERNSEPNNRDEFGDEMWEEKGMLEAVEGMEDDAISANILRADVEESKSACINSARIGLSLTQ
jgi:hypothetical protein